jgi:hypothetical protein
MSGMCRIRGTGDALLKFFREGVNKYDYDIDKGENILVPREKWYKEIESDGYIECCSDSWAYVEGTRRGFFENLDALIDIGLEGELQTVEVCVDQAWRFDVEDWQKVSEKYGIDLWLRGEELGNAFSQEVKVVGGKIKIDRSEDFDDWDDEG